MAAPAFNYYPTLLAAWRSYRTGRDRQVGSPAAARRINVQIAELREQLARLEQMQARS